MEKEKAINLVFTELEKAEEKYPDFYSDPIHACAVMCEEAGEALQASLDLTYLDGTYDDMIKEVAQTGAMAIRILMNIEKMKTSQKYMDK